MYEIVAKGTGPTAGPVRRSESKTLSLPDGRVIFSSRKNNQTVTFVLGAKQVIAGVDEGVTGMPVGERRSFRSRRRLTAEHSTRSSFRLMPSGTMTSNWSKS